MDIENIREKIIEEVYAFGQDYDFRQDDSWEEYERLEMEIEGLTIEVELRFLGFNEHHKTIDWADPEYDSGVYAWIAREVKAEDAMGREVDLGIDLRTLEGKRFY